MRGVLIATSIAVLVVLIALAVFSELQVEPPGGWPGVREASKRFGYLGGFLLIYVEESGVPLLIPGDAFLVYVGHRLPANPLAWLAAWAGFVAAVVLGSMNLFLLSRRLGRRVLTHPVARFLHLTQERLEKAESEFLRWGPWAVIAGRHVPGLRVPITVAAGILGMKLRIFLASVAISSAVWAAVFLALGRLRGFGGPTPPHADNLRIRAGGTGRGGRMDFQETVRQINPWSTGSGQYLLATSTPRGSPQDRCNRLAVLRRPHRCFCG